jgi:Ca2+-binding EF-hand superfamily protein
VDETVNRLMQFDKNADGKLAKDEVPERMQAVFERGDKDKDGFLNKDEVKAVAEAPRPEGAPRRQGGPVPPSQ